MRATIRPKAIALSFSAMAKACIVHGLSTASDRDVFHFYQPTIYSLIGHYHACIDKKGVLQEEEILPTLILILRSSSPSLQFPCTSRSQFSSLGNATTNFFGVPLQCIGRILVTPVSSLDVITTILEAMISFEHQKRRGVCTSPSSLLVRGKTRNYSIAVKVGFRF